MINAAIIYPRNLDAKIGPSQTINRIIQHSDYLKKNQINITVFKQDLKKNNTKKRASSDIKKFNTNSFIRKYLYIFYIFYLEIMTYRYVRDFLKQGEHYDVLIFHHLTSFLYYAVLDKFFTNNTEKVRIYLFQHNNGNFFDMGLKNYPALKYTLYVPICKYIFKKFYHRITKVIFISQNAQVNFKKTVIQFPIQTKVILNGIYESNIVSLIKGNLNEPTKTIKLITVGSVCSRKGQDIVIEALSLLNKKSKQFKYTIVGNGPQHQEFVQLAKDLNVYDCVEFTGNLEPSEVEKKMIGHDICILMSSSEGLPLSLLEGLRSGLVIFTTATSGCPETVVNNNGFIIKRDAQELAYQLSILNPQHIKEMKIRSRQLFEFKFNFKYFMNSYMELIKSNH